MRREVEDGSDLRNLQMPWWDPAINSEDRQPPEFLRTRFQHSIVPYDRCVEVSNAYPGTGTRSIPAETFAIKTAWANARHAAIEYASVFCDAMSALNDEFGLGKKTREIARVLFANLPPEVHTSISKTFDQNLAQAQRQADRYLATLDEARLAGDPKRDFRSSLNLELFSLADTGGYEMSNERVLQKELISALQRYASVECFQTPEAREALGAAAIAVAMERSMRAASFEAVAHHFNHRDSRALEELGIQRLANMKETTAHFIFGPPASGKSSYRRHVIDELKAGDASVRALDFDIYRPYVAAVHASEAEAPPGPYIMAITESEVIPIYENIQAQLLRYARYRTGGLRTHVVVDHLNIDMDVASAFCEAHSKCVGTFIFCHPHEELERAFERGKRNGRFFNFSDLLHISKACFESLPAELAGLRHYLREISLRQNDGRSGLRPREVAVLDSRKMELRICSVPGFCALAAYSTVNVWAKDPGELWASDEDPAKFLQAFEARFKVVVADPQDAGIDRERLVERMRDHLASVRETDRFS